MGNRYHLLSLSIAILLFTAVPRSFAQWKQSNGPYGGVINSVACVGNVMLAGTNSGLFRSSDGGNYWSQVSMMLNGGPRDVYSLKEEDGIVIAGTNSGAFTSSDSGLTWKSLSVYPSLAPVIDISLFDSLMVYRTSSVDARIVTLTNDFQSVGSSLGTLFVLNNGSTADTVLQAFDIDSTSVIVGTNHGVYVSRDSGRSWSVSDAGLTQLDVTALKVDGNMVFAGTDSGIYSSTDRGASWRASGSGLAGIPVNSIGVDGANVFACTDGAGVFMSTDGGTTWTEINAGLTNLSVNSITFLANTPFAGTQGNGVFMFNGNWTPVSDGLGATSIVGLAAVGGDIFAATYGGGVFLSTDNGTSWTTSNTGLANLYVRSIVAKGTSLFVATQGGGIFKSTDEGRDWFASNAGINQKFVNCLFADSTQILAGTMLPTDAPQNLLPSDSTWADSGMVYRSTNDGASWNPMNTRLFTVRAVAAVGSAIVASGLIYTVRSTDGGSSWTPVNVGAKSQTFAILDSTIVGGTLGGGVYYSTDQGLNWAQSSLSNFTTGLSTVPAVAIVGKSAVASWESGSDPLFAGVLRSARDTLSKWTALDSGLVDEFLPPVSVPVVTSFTASDNFLFAGTENAGVWMLPLSQAMGVNAGNPAPPSHFTLSQNYPNPFNPTTDIGFRIADVRLVTLKVYNVLGELVKTLVNKVEQPGSYQVQFDGSNLASGVYFYRLAAGSYLMTKKMLLLK